MPGLRPSIEGATLGDEAEREALRRALAAAIGAEHAAKLMERIPPVTWDELARRSDVVALQRDVDTLKTDVGTLKTDVGTLKTDLRAHAERGDLKMDALRFEVIGEFRRQMVEQNRLLFFSTIGAIFTSASLAFAAATF